MSGVARPLDLRSVQWLLAAMVFVIAPHALRMPWWVGTFFGGAVALRLWIAMRARRAPPRWLLVLVTLGAVGAVLVTYGRLLGRDSGTALLVLMAAMKLLEMRTDREVTLAIHLGFILVMTNFLFSQTIPMGLYMLVCVWLFVATLVGFQRVGDRAPTVRERLQPAAVLLLQAAPLMLVLFVLFPRMTGPLWALPLDARAGLTGLSDTMTPGTISSLIESGNVAFRVDFEEAVPPGGSLYWRGPVLDRFDGRTWARAESTRPTAREVDRGRQSTRYSVTLEPHGKNWLFALDMPASLPSGAALRSDWQLVSDRPVDTRQRYEMSSWVDYSFGLTDESQARATALGFDDARNPRTVALGRQWAREFVEPERIVGQALRYFNTRFAYTLEPPLLDGPDPYDQFVFETRRGFCEHYAGSFALLMRAAGVPARVVTGYQGGEVNPINRELIVRQADAHAWTEVWLAGRGWVRVDPTSVVAPVRIEGGINAALGPIGVLPTLIAADRLRVLANVRFAWEAVNSRWNQWVLGYNVERQRDFLSRLGLPSTDARTLAIWLAGIATVIGAVVGLALVAREFPKRGDAVRRAWDRYCRKLAAAGLERAPHEGPEDFLARVSRARPDLAPAATDITRRYVEARYGHGGSKDDIRALRRAVTRLRCA